MSRLRFGCRRVARAGLVCVVALTACSAILCFGGRSAFADGPDAEIEAHLAAGEFSIAFDRAKALDDAQARDRQLAAIAGRQSAAGADRASWTTLGEMTDDRQRAQALADLGRGRPLGGGAGAADFDALIELIETTVAPTSWEAVGGAGTIQEFEAGVRVDLDGLMRPALEEDASSRLARLRMELASSSTGGDAHRSSPLRCVSLVRLERAMQLRAASRRPFDDEMLLLAGLQKIQYVIAFPDSRDVVVAGPAGDWTLDREGRIVGADSGRPVVRLDDAVTLLRHTFAGPNTRFGCSIDPTKEGLARVQEFLRQSSGKPLAAGTRGRWLEDVRSRLGRQTVSVYGLDPRSRAAHLIVEADYRMKLVGLGLEPGTIDVPSYLSTITVERGQSPPPMDVLRWWFTANYDAVVASADRDIFELRGQGVRLLSENEMLTAEGRRVQTGQTDALNADFARRFTQHFAALAQKYAVYAELQNVFDLALAMSLIKQHALADRAQWHMTYFGDAGDYAVELATPPSTVETVVNHRVIHRTQIIAAVSGGVRVQVDELARNEALATDRTGRTDSQRDKLKPRGLESNQWWWD